MAKYSVTVTRDCTESVSVEVEAESAAAAEAMALEEVNGDPCAWEWVQDDCSGSQSEPYTNGADPLNSCPDCGEEYEGPDYFCPDCAASYILNGHAPHDVKAGRLNP